MTDAKDRLLGSLPAIYRAYATDELRHLLGAFEAVLFCGEKGGIRGIEQEIEAIPSLFAPLGAVGEGKAGGIKAPDRFLPWLAGWVAFSPHELFTPTQLRKIVAGIVPLYGYRGTRAYLEKLLKLCFEEIRSVDIDEQPNLGFKVGQVRMGEDSFLTGERPFWFRVALDLDTSTERRGGQAESRSVVEHRIRAVIDFAKPAHTEYDVEFHYHAAGRNKTSRETLNA
jgi:phage tail-like protein